MTDFIISCTAGFATGIISAFGIGGGTFLLLIMTLFLGVAEDAARSINLLYFIPTALTSLYYHARGGYLDRTVIRTAVPFGIAFGILGAVLSFQLHAAFLHKIFGLYLLLAAVSVFLPRKKDPENG